MLYRLRKVKGVFSKLTRNKERLHTSATFEPKSAWSRRTIISGEACSATPRIRARIFTERIERFP